MKLSLAMFEICSWSDPCRSAIGPGERGVWRVDSLVCYLPSRVRQPGEVTHGSMWREACGERRAGEARMHLTRREVCASASHRPLTARHGRPCRVWARSKQPTVPAPRRHRGGALCRRPEARAAAFHRLRVLGSSRILRNSGPRSLVAWSGSSPEGVGRRRWGAKAVGSATLGQATGPRRPDRRGCSSRAPGRSPAPARGCLEQPWSGGCAAWAGCCACAVTCDAVDRGGVHDREVRLLVARALVRVRVRVRVRARAS